MVMFKQFGKNVYRYILLGMGLWVATVSGAGTLTVLDIPELVTQADILKESGVVKKDDHEHYFYLSVSPAYVKKLYPILMAHLNDAEKRCLLPDNNSKGSHISLAYAEDHAANLITPYLGKQFEFSPQAIDRYSEKKCNWQRKCYQEAWYVLRVKSVALEKIVPKKTLPLHISIGVARYSLDKAADCIYGK